ncbi:MAG: hypothetical protein HZA37_00340 [Parcubacteria group bacterium]|nr:hypothetical protein [Parcubacteria group bacterium]
MPYIPQSNRDRLDPHIAKLAEEINGAAKEAGDEKAFAGLLNYACTRIALKTIPEKRYWAVALVSGVFKNIGDEFYRRFAAPYEDEQIKKNGDVY